MNFILLEGVSFWIVLAAAITLIAITAISVICLLIFERRISFLESRLYLEGKKLKRLFKKNLELSFKSGEYDIDEK